MRLGREALVRRWSNARLEELMEQIRKPSPELLDQMLWRHEFVGKPQPPSRFRWPAAGRSAGIAPSSLRLDHRFVAAIANDRLWAGFFYSYVRPHK